MPRRQTGRRRVEDPTAEPHLAATPEDHKTAEYVAEKFRAAGLETEIVPYRVLLNQPKVVRVEAFDAAGKLLMSGPTREHVGRAIRGQDDPRVVMPFNGSSGSGDVTGEVVYANYGRLEDFDQLAAAAHRPARQDRASSATAPTSAASRSISPSSAAPPACSSTPTRRTTATSRAMRIRSARGGPKPACSAGRCSISSNIPATRRLPA